MTTTTFATGDLVKIDNPHCDPAYNVQGVVTGRIDTVSDAIGNDYYFVKPLSGYFEGQDGAGFEVAHLTLVAPTVDGFSVGEVVVVNTNDFPALNARVGDLATVVDFRERGVGLASFVRCRLDSGVIFPFRTDEIAAVATAKDADLAYVGDSAGLRALPDETVIVSVESLVIRVKVNGHWIKPGYANAGHYDYSTAFLAASEGFVVAFAPCF